MLEPFEGTAERGVRTLDDAELDALGASARAHGATLALHAIGDAATRAALDAFARWPAADRQRLRPRIEHAQLVHPADRPRFRELGVIASMQPTHAVSDRKIAAQLWGTRQGYAWRQLEDAGAMLALGSDVPIESIDPRLGLRAATTEGGDRTLSFERALHGFTTGAAHAVRREHELGRIAEGFLADFVVWDRDPAKDGHIAQTWVDGVRLV
jgi:predicted amidohydrolase YtcJ